MAAISLSSATSARTAVAGGAAEALRLLRDVLDRCAAAGRLRVEPGVAAQAIMSANVGVALCLVTQPDAYVDPDLSVRVRDAVHARLLVTGTPAPAPCDVTATAVQLSAQLRASPDARLTQAEQAVLHEWLDRITGPSPAGDVKREVEGDGGDRDRADWSR